ncbi:MAG TPA: hypothetical protein PLB63_02505 [Planctomycetota bacterium]|nr:hypothetical protein [Planctomycetota bacterium]HQA99820.1 hypothetical protein [Planctomycetota bacterium]
MNISVKCKCGKILLISSQFGGKRGRCPFCSRLLFIPEYKADMENTLSATCPNEGIFILGKINETTDEVEFMYEPQQNTVECMHESQKNTAEFMHEPQQNTVEKIEKNTSKHIKKFHLILFYCISFYAICCTICCLYFYFSLPIQIQKENLKNLQKQEDVILLSYKDMVSLNKFLETKDAELQQLLQEQRFEEIITRLTPNILETLSQQLSLHHHSLQNIDKSLQKLIKTYSGITQKVKAQEQQRTKMAEILKDYQQQYETFILKFQNLMYNRNYEEAQKNLEKLWQPLHFLEHIDSDEPLLEELRSRLKEVQSMKALLQLAIEGANAVQGLTKAFFVRDGRVILGQLQEYSKTGDFTIHTENQIKVHISMKALSSEDIVYFAMNTKTEQNVHLYAGIFYLYEKKYNLAQQSFSEAVKHGADIQEIQKYIKITQQVAVSEQQSKQKSN